MLSGQVWDGEEAIIEEEMPAGLCHNNSIKVWIEQDNIKICTGYALSDDRWIRHTWIVDGDGNIHECTPVKREKYFGAILNKEEAEKFRREYDYEYGAKCAKEEAGGLTISTEDIGRKTLSAQQDVAGKESITPSINNSRTNGAIGKDEIND